MRHTLVVAVAWVHVGCVIVGCAVGCGPTAAPPAAAPVQNRDTAEATVTRESEVGPVHCFSWVHLDDFSTDCFRTPAACEEARLEMQAGSRDVTPCDQLASGSCTKVGRDVPDDERCFGDVGNCERYRAYVTGNGLVTTTCTTP